jgi:hypothetical protein
MPSMKTGAVLSWVPCAAWQQIDWQTDPSKGTKMTNTTPSKLFDQNDHRNFNYNLIINDVIRSFFVLSYQLTAMARIFVKNNMD